MKTIIIASQKGGSGKTTLARNLAVLAAGEGQRVVLMDLDPQLGLLEWAAARGENEECSGPYMDGGAVDPRGLRRGLRLAAPDYDLCLIDTPPRDTPSLANALRQADLVLVPVRPSPDDLRAVGATLAALQEAGTPFAFILNQTPRARITEEAVRVLAQHGRVSPTNIALRIAYATSAATGLAVTETGDRKASAEITATWDYVRSIL